MTCTFSLSHFGLSFHAAVTAVLAEMLRDLGHSVGIREATHEEMFRMHKAGEVDPVCTDWLPGSQEV